MKMESPKYHYTKSIWAVLLCCLIAVSCTQEEELAAVGYLSFPGIEVSRTVEDMAGTRAVEDLPEISTPAVSAVTFVIKDAANNIKHNGVLEGPQPLPEGTYSVEASYNTNSFGIPYLTGTKSDITIKAGETTTQTIGLSLQNSLISVSVDESLKDHFIPDGTVTISAEGITETETETVNLNTWYYVPSGKKITLTVPGKSSVGVSKDFTYTIDATIPQKAYTVYCGETGKNDLPTITLPDQQAGAWNTRLYVTPAKVTNMSAANQAKIIYEVSESNDEWSTIATSELIEGNYHVIKGLTNDKTYYVRARLGEQIISEAVSFKVNENLPGTNVTLAHKNDNSGNLDRTDATLTLGLTGILQTLKDEGLLNVSATLTDGTTTYRTSSADGIMGVNDNWPYLPHKLSYRLTVNQSVGEETPIKSTKMGYKVNAPNLNLTLGGYTSYTKYKEGDIKGANACNPYMVFSPKAEFNVSTTLMGMDKYSPSFSCTYAGTAVSLASNANTCTLDNKTGVKASLTPYILSAKATFDDMTFEESRDFYITGLPAHFAAPWVATGWDIDGKAEFGNDKVRVGSWDYNSYIANNGFAIPKGTSVEFNYNLLLRSRAADSELRITLGEDQLFYDSKYAFWGENYTYSNTKMFSTSSDASQLKCATKASIGGDNYADIYSLDLIYK